MSSAASRWRETWRRLEAPVADDGLLRDLMARYSEAHRKYHTLRHLDECFAKQFIVAYESTARENLTRSIRQLGG